MLIANKKINISMHEDSEDSDSRGGPSRNRCNRFVKHSLGQFLCTSPVIDNNTDLSRLAAYFRRAMSINPTYG
ncbi:hypothetical protein AYI69_g5308 [Smittium culicis]|uniref:Uncharacterized protein n=1 Tax=Smittium culicis TaxID=133412 RepID=A0A1R1Y7L6_9FUNG|nr:hypothetical protein AYI69_g5308 [Smittium culicis]